MKQIIVENTPDIETGIVQTLGISGYTLLCLEAVDAVLNSDVPPFSATVVSGVVAHANEHLFILWGWGHTEALIIPSGFSSGYSGEGPRGFSMALCMLLNTETPTSLIQIRDDFFDRIDGGNCPVETLRTIKASARPIDILNSGWILTTHEALLSDRRLPTAFHWRDKGVTWTNDADIVGQASENSGDKLVIAAGLLRSGASPEECQQCGILVRDAWIELCHSMRIPTAGLIATSPGDHDVKGMLRTFCPDGELLKECSQAYSSALALQHRRDADLDQSKACFDSSISCMASLVRKVDSDRSNR